MFYCYRMSLSEIPDNSKNINYRLYILDPLSVIVKLAIISNKPVGSKLCIKDNVVYIQEPGFFQSMCRMYLNANKTDLQYMYNPIQLACEHYLNVKYVEKTPNIKKLFNCAIRGLDKMKETYKSCPIIVLCLHSYTSLIENYLEQYYNESLFKKDAMTFVYNNETVNLLNLQWTIEKIKIVLDMIEFLAKDNMAINNVQSLEIFINNIDSGIHALVCS
jgi:hypothetical protein